MASSSRKEKAGKKPGKKAAEKARKASPKKEKTSASKAGGSSPAPGKKKEKKTSGSAPAPAKKKEKKTRGSSPAPGKKPEKKAAKPVAKPGKAGGKTKKPAAKPAAEAVKAAKGARPAKAAKPAVAEKTARPKSAQARPKGYAVFVGTRKGAWILRSDGSRQKWKLEGPHFLGCIIHHMVLDPRDGKTLLMAARTGHLGPTIFRSTNLGKSWKEAERPPAFRKAKPGEPEWVVDHVFWVTPGHASQPGVWYAGSSPQGLFRSEDGGATWSPVAGFNDHPERINWVGGEKDMTPDGGKMHSILIDPRDARHMYLGMSSGGVFESLDAGESWAPLNKGCEADFLPVKEAEYGHDPHCVRLHPADPDRLYQQNHCGIYRMDRAAGVWERIGRKMPKKVGDIGFPIVLDPADPNRVWVFPMDGTEVWPRTSPDGKPAVYTSGDAGKSWTRLDKGLPPEQGWFTVKRQAMAGDDSSPVGLYFGTTSGEVWASRNAGQSWSCIARHLPQIYTVTATELLR